MTTHVFENELNVLAGTPTTSFPNTRSAMHLPTYGEGTKAKMSMRAPKGSSAVPLKNLQQTKAFVNFENLSSQPPIVTLRLDSVKKQTGYGRTSIYALMDPNSPYFDPTFPRSFKISGNAHASAVGWCQQEIQAWLAARMAARSIACTHTEQK